MSSGALSLAAFFNAMIITGVLFVSKYNLTNEELLFFAKVIVLQSIFARIVTSNNIYFKEEASRYLYQLIKIVLVLCWGGFLFSVFIYSIGPGDEWVFMEATLNWWLMGIAFTVVNISNVIIRQSILLLGEYRILVQLHLIELILSLIHI